MMPKKAENSLKAWHTDTYMGEFSEFPYEYQHDMV